MVYVDDMRVAFGRMLMCHMIADTTKELDEMADRVGVARRWKQYPGSHREHYGLCLSKRRLAVKAGAVEISQREAWRTHTYKKEEGRAWAKLTLLSTPVLTWAGPSGTDPFLSQLA